MEQGGALPGFLMLCCVTVWPFFLGLLLGWLLRSRTITLGWLGLLPKWLRDRIVYEP